MIRTTDALAWASEWPRTALPQWFCSIKMGKTARNLISIQRVNLVSLSQMKPVRRLQACRPRPQDRHSRNNFGRNRPLGLPRLFGASASSEVWTKENLTMRKSATKNIAFGLVAVLALVLM